jgi:hypothetical protein
MGRFMAGYSMQALENSGDEVGVSTRSVRRLLALAFFGLISLCGSQWTMAQGKIGFNNNTLWLVYYDATVPELGGSAVSSSNMPPGITLMADLYMGTDSSTLYLYSSAAFSTTAGRWNAVSVVANTNPVTGAPTLYGQAYIVTQVRDASLTPPSIWTPATSPFGNYYGVSQEFTFCVCGGITYPPMWGTAGTWAAGTFPLDQYGAGFKGAIAVASPVGLPQFCCGPMSQTAVVGSNVTLSSLSSPVVDYQWQFNGTNIPAASTSSLTLNNVQFTDAGNYRLFGTNNYGFGASSIAVLQVLPPNGPSIRINDQLAVRTVHAAAPATISIAGGFTNGFIFYTLDGSTPTTSSTLYNGPFALTNGAVIQAMSLSADFSQSALSPPVTLVIAPGFSLQTSVSGSGTISPSSGVFASNTVITLTANAASAWAFDHWAGDLMGNANPTNLTMNGPKNVQAVFVPTAFPISVTTPGAGTVAVNGQTNPPQTFFPTNTVVTLAATPGNGWSFMGWQGTVSSTNNPLSLAITQSNYVVGVFGTTVNTNIAGNGTVSFNHTNPIPFGTLVTATALPAPGNRFVTWSQVLTGTNNPAAFTVSNPSPTVGALFTSSGLPPVSIAVELTNISSGLYAAITIDGVAGHTYGINYTTDLTHTNSWVTLTNLTLTSQVETWVDLGTDVRSTKARYYRVTAQ